MKANWLNNVTIWYQDLININLESVEMIEWIYFEKLVVDNLGRDKDQT